MKFETLTVQDIKSISQRSILWYWSELAGSRRFPAFSDFQFDARMIDPKGLMVWGVEHAGGRRKFRARHQGLRLAQTFHADWVGRTMDEVIPAAVRTYALDAAEECASSGCAIFSVLSTFDPAGDRIDCERLLLPFGSDAEVQHILASMKLISLKGSFERRTVLNNFRMVSKVELAGRIPAGFRKPAISTPGVVIKLQSGPEQSPGLGGIIQHTASDPAYQLAQGKVASGAKPVGAWT